MTTQIRWQEIFGEGFFDYPKRLQVNELTISEAGKVLFHDYH